MPYPLKNGGKEIQERRSSIEGTKFASYSDDKYGRLKVANEVQTLLGIQIGEDGTIPRRNHIQPRIFIMRPDENGIDKLTFLSTANISYGTKEFWDQVAMGNIFALPAGEKDPVQLQVDDDANHLQFSKPITTENIPSANPKKPSWWQRFRHFISGGRAYAKEWNAYYKQDEGKRHMASQLSNMKKDATDKVLEEEVQVADAKNEEIRIREEKEREQGIINGAKRNANEVETGLANTISVWKPDSELLDHMDKEKHGYGFFSKEQFKALNKYGKDQIDLSTIKVGNSGQTVTDEEFACVGMVAGWNPEYAIKEANRGAALDIHAEKSIKGAGFSEKETKGILGSMTRSMYTTDLFNNIPRDNSGGYYNAINSGKKDALEAFNDYKDGKTEKLGTLLANGINETSRDLLTLESPDISFNSTGTMVMAEKLVGLLQKDPALYQAALDKGMNPESFKMAQGLVELNKLVMEKRKAQLALAEDAYGENRDKLTAEEKAELTKKIVKADLALTRMATDNCNDNDIVMNKTLEVTDKMQNVNKFDLEKWAKHPETRPEPKPGKIYSDTASAVINYFRCQNRDFPESVINLTTEGGKKELDNVAEQMVKQENLAEKTSKELYHGLDNKTLFKYTDSSAKAIKELATEKQLKKAGIAEPEKKPVVNQAQNNAPKKTGTIADRAKMFEPKPNQAGGPIA